MKMLFGKLNLQNYEYVDESQNIISFSNDNYHVSICGDLLLDEQTNQPQQIIELYEKYNNDITKHLFGLYILIVYDKKRSSLSIYQDRTTSPITLYYTYSKDVFYYSTSLKKLLLNSKVNRKLNEDVVETFIVNGFIYSEQTLVRDVYKIKAFHCLNISVNGVEQVPVSYQQTEYTKQKALKEFKTVLDQAIIRQASGETEINAPLSSGYDSSYIVDVLSKQTDLPINAFSIGGKFGKNELPVVEQNIKYFPRVKLISELTNSSTLQNYPDIVWKLEGNVYEIGLFLQYELNKLVNEKGKKTLICGECADQVMNQYYFDEERNNATSNQPDKYYEFSEYPYVFGSYLILKKNGILANSFDIKTKYPYLDDEFVALNKPLAEYNGKKKTAHKENSEACLPKEIIENISKIGGSTDCHSLFNNHDEIKAFLKFVEKSDFYKKHRGLIKKHSYSEKIKPDLITRFKTKIRNIIFFIMRKDKNKDGEYYNEEMKLNEYLCYAYLMLFEELFLSGREDEKFEQVAINKLLKTFYD